MICSFIGLISSHRPYTQLQTGKFFTYIFAVLLPKVREWAWRMSKAL